MLDSFFVSNFRLFKRLELPKLSRVNLIVGKNGSGKSALLEAIHLYASNGNLQVLLDSIRARQEGFGQDSVFRHLFYGHKLPQIDGQGIRVGYSDAQEKYISITQAAYRIEDTKNGLTNRRLKKSEIPLDSVDVNLFLIVEDGGESKRVVGLKRDLYELRTFHASLELNNPDKSRFFLQKVSTQVVNTNHLALLWDKLALTDLEDEVISGLQLMKSEIKGLTFVEGQNDQDSKERVPLVKLEGLPEPTSLKSLGDGIYRLLHIILALVNAKDGVLLIDELENGLHWKIHPKVWDVVFRLSKKLNVQVFATTHSSDCIRGFETAWREHPDAGTFFRLDVKEDHVKATYYNHETLKDALVADVEVR